MVFIDSEMAGTDRIRVEFRGLIVGSELFECLRRR